MSVNAAPTADARSLRLTFDEGTILVEGLPEGDDAGLPGVKFDPRAGLYRAEAIWYRAIVQHLHRKVAYTDDARAYEPARWAIRVAREAFPHQTEG
ncbi:MAG: ATP-dependent helicase, partial [Planctomycetia bacterium]|nr:ATP-dependent helicase [Planctomycetia bacterium]